LRVAVLEKPLGCAVSLNLLWLIGELLRCPVANIDTNVLGGCPVLSGAPVTTDANIAK
jgi:hypothetical protein